MAIKHNVVQKMTWVSGWIGKECFPSTGKWNESCFRPPLCTYRLNWARRTSWGLRDDWDDPDTGFKTRALAVWGRARYLSATEAPHNTDVHTWMGKKHFCFFQTAETENRNPNSGVKGSGANHYPRAPAPFHWCFIDWLPAAYSGSSVQQRCQCSSRISEDITSAVSLQCRYRCWSWYPWNNRECLTLCLTGGINGVYLSYCYSGDYPTRR